MEEGLEDWRLVESQSIYSYYAGAEVIYLFIEPLSLDGNSALGTASGLGIKW